MRRSPPQDRDAEVRRRLRELAEEWRRFGVQRLHVLLRREGLVVNHKRTERLYREERLSLHLRPTKKRPCVLRSCHQRPSADEQWGISGIVNGVGSSFSATLYDAPIPIKVSMRLPLHERLDRRYLLRHHVINWRDKGVVISIAWH